VRRAEILDTHNVLSGALPEGDTSYACLSLIDRYGNTYLDRSQMPLLIEEIDRLRASNDVPATYQRSLLEILDEIERMAQQALDEPHLYLAFIGD
jgi:hypothetical protein